MKFCVTFKTPDVVEDTIKYACRDLIDNDHESPIVNGQLNESHNDVQACQEITKRFVLYGEYITIEFDTEKKTATVVPI